MKWQAHKQRALAVVALALLICFDRFFKRIAHESWQFNPVEAGFFKFSYFENPHIAFSIPISGVFLEIVIGAIIVALGLWLWKGLKTGFGGREWGVALLLAGAIGNFYDRLQYGFIIDYIEIGSVPVFNAADALIMAGAACIIYSLWRESSRRIS